MNQLRLYPPSARAICLWIPLFPLRCEELRRPELGGRPAAILSPGDTRRIWQVSHPARRIGVRAGMTVSQAIGLCPPLAILEPDPVHYDERFTRLLLALENVSPVIEPAELGRVYVGADGLERLYGGPEKQLDAVTRAVRRYGGKAIGETTAVRQDGSLPSPTPHPTAALPFSRSAVAGRGGGGRAAVVGPGGWGWAGWARLGWARGKFVSWVAAARAKPGSPVIVSDAGRAAFLASQPVAVLPISADTHRRLRQLGINTLRDLARLPETALVSQFGREGRCSWRLASGAAADPVIGRERPEPITAAMDFPTPVADRGMLAHTIKQLIGRALNHPRRIGWRVQVVRVQANLEQGASWMIEAILKDPSADRDRITAPLTVRLEQSPPTGAVERLAVEFTSFARGTEELQLFARDANSAARAGRRRALRTAAREIATRLKRRMLYHIVEVQPWSRIPERRYALIDFEY